MMRLPRSQPTSISLAPAARPRRLRDLVVSPTARPLRFAGTGMAAGSLQLVLLATLTSHGWNAIPANLTAFLLAAQLNFLLSSALTWRDRRGTGSLARRWLLFHGSIATMALLNMFVFTLARLILPALAASALGIAAGALGNYVAGDRLVFRPLAEQSSPQGRRAA